MGPAGVSTALTLPPETVIPVAGMFSRILAAEIAEGPGKGVGCALGIGMAAAIRVQPADRPL